jgi:hypothetical protein
MFVSNGRKYKPFSVKNYFIQMNIYEHIHQKNPFVKVRIFRKTKPLSN